MCVRARVCVPYGPRPFFLLLTAGTLCGARALWLSLSLSLSLSLYIYIYMYIYLCVCLCVHYKAFRFLSQPRGGACGRGFIIDMIPASYTSYSICINSKYVLAPHPLHVRVKQLQLHLDMYICMYEYMFIYVCTYTYMHTCMHTCINTNAHTHTHTLSHTHTEAARARNQDALFNREHILCRTHSIQNTVT